jgi:hypothetical protein
MCLVLSKDQLDIQLPKIIPAFLNIVKKEKGPELLPVIQVRHVVLPPLNKLGIKYVTGSCHKRRK